MAPLTPTDRRSSAWSVASGEVRWDVIETASMVELDDVVDNACLGETTVNTEEWNGSNRIGKRHGRVPRTVEHSGPKGTWALDADGDGVREVHCNTLEGLWTGARNFLRPFRGVSKWFLAQYVAVGSCRLTGGGLDAQ